MRSPGPRTFRGLSVAIVAAGPEIVGGHSVQARRLADALQAEGAEVRYVAINRPLPSVLRHIKQVPGLRTLVNEGLYAGSLRALANADVVHVFSASYWSFLLAPVPAMLAGRGVGADVVLHYHSGELEDHLATWGWRVHPWLRLANQIVVCSDFQRQAFARYGYTARVIPNLVDLQQFTFRSRQPLRPRFLCNRSLEALYGLDVVLDAFARIQRRYPRASLVIAGAGSEVWRLRAHVAAHQIQNVQFLGAVAHADMPALLTEHDIFLNGSRIDNQPVSLIEAFAAGLLVISTRTGGIPEMIDHGHSGWLVDQDDSSAMADAAIEALDRPDYAAAMCAAARAHVGQYAWEAVRPRWADVYRCAGDAAWPSTRPMGIDYPIAGSQGTRA